MRNDATTSRSRARRIGAALAALATAYSVTTLPVATGHAEGPAPVTRSDSATPSGAPAYRFPGNDGKPHRVTYDKNSFMIDGQRLNVWSGEIHYWRLPSQEAWRDVMRKARASGFNAVSLYFFWGLHQETENGPFDFSGIRDIDALLSIAEQEGLYVIVRPGPYVNAEISMGGLPAFMTNRSGALRGMDNLEQSKVWLKAFDAIARKHLVTRGGGSIIMYQVENEMLDENADRAAFVKALTSFVKSDGIDVPVFHNDYNLGGRYADTAKYGTDFYAYDSYPLGFTCNAPRRAIPDTEDAFRRFAPDTPQFITEAQGGAFTPWGAPFTPSQCYDYTDPSFIRQWGTTNIGNGVTAFNYYMLEGGTNWGWTGAPASGFTSYDYGSSITENRVLTEKVAVQKEIGYFQRALPWLTASDPVDAPAATEVKGAAVKSYQRLAGTDPQGPRYLGFRLSDSNATTDTTFATPLWLDAGGAGASNVTIDDRDPAITYQGAWTKQTDASASDGTISTSSAKGASASYTFTGTSISYVSSTGTGYGKASVSIDGGAPVTVDGHVDSDQNRPSQQVLHQFTGLSAGSHTITVTNLGAPATGGTGTTIAIDSFVVGGAAAGVVHNDSEPGFLTFSGTGWQHTNGQAWAQTDIGQDEAYSDVKGDSYSFTITGTGFDLVSSFSENHARAAVTIDGTPAGTTEETTVQPAQAQKTIFSRSDLPAGTHTVTVTNTGEPFANSSGTFISIDAVRVHQGRTTTVKRTGWARIPQDTSTALHLHGRDSLMMAANLDIAGHKVAYTTSQPFGAPLTTSPRGTVQYLVGHRDDPGETVLQLTAGQSRPTVRGEGVRTTWDATTGQLRLNYTHGSTPTDITVGTGAEALTLRIIDRQYAATTWQLESTVDGRTVRTDVEGAYLAGQAVLTGSMVALQGQMTQPGRLTVLTDKAVTAATWNGSPLPTLEGSTVPGPVRVEAPTLSWRAKDGAPEAARDYDDSSWTTVTSTTPSTTWQKPVLGGVVLDSNHLGLYEGSVWYRAHFTSDGGTTMKLNANGGKGAPGPNGKDPAFMQVWVNGTYLGAPKATGGTTTLTLPEGIKAGDPVVVSVLVHNLGQNLDWSDDGLSRQSRGLNSASLPAQGSPTWRARGAVPTATSGDTARGLYNNGGLTGEREGWHLPGYPTSDWAPATTLKADQPGVRWYRATFDLSVPKGQDTAFEVVVKPSGQGQGIDGVGADHSQATIFVNGWNTGVYVGDVGPQTRFPIPAGFIDPHGTNSIAIAVAAKEAGAGPESVSIEPVHSATGALVSSLNPAPRHHGGSGEATPTPTPTPTAPATPTPPATPTVTSTPSAPHGSGSPTPGTGSSTSTRPGHSAPGHPRPPKLPHTGR
ncbi:beta-galactosidase [Acidipropionibacterium timonense]|uniref:beta-galactosidase n=1 Tax=Acidipropionibacterium timonense TaxID=2161818 RepID=UPI001AEBF6E4|nr:beta-galactosidase [Acidipropionibacterium timonense]